MLRISTTNRISALLIGLMAPLLWSLFPAFTLIEAKIPPLQLLSMIFTLSAIIAVCYWIIFRINPIKLAVECGIRNWVLGISGVTIYNLLLLSALRFAVPIESYLINASWPILSIFFAVLLIKEPLRQEHIYGCILCFSGILFIAFNGGFAGFSAGSSHGHIIAALGAILWSLYSVLSRRFAIKIEYITLFCFATPFILAPLHFALEQTVPIDISDAPFILPLGLGSAGIAYYFWNYGVVYGDVRLLSIFAYLGHLIAVILLIHFGFAEFSWKIVTAFILIIGGSLTASLRIPTWRSKKFHVVGEEQ